ncbi:MAG: hypothetical protein GWM90_27370 [Gemmatimonadetes bacterium]|nr:hypothetical protein [Gemmatimonadota bacterium]NIQ58694.1 hypothetical protein [Gemmatimonadota bacterium]NIU78884.1 hypothetical protein [Gammaproteobacteria bacterium]NIX47652.1 hypothetical protein [Gemmatimonadota bacterium]NIY12022.1 hypothetical protein [Gemmatimonadota bacterium]
MMDETPGTEPRPAMEPVRKKRGRGMLWALLAVVVAFLAGFGWQWYEASTVRDELAATRQELRVERLRVRLGQATLAAQAGDYESARQQMSEFFTTVQQQSATLPDSVAAVTDGLLAMRDEVITGLSRSNPEFAGVLYGMLERFRNAAGLPAAGGTPMTGARPEAGPEGQPAVPGADTAAAADTGPPGTSPIP